MKLLPLVLTNLLCVGVGIGAYDMIKSDRATASNDGGQVALMDGSELEARISALEASVPNGPAIRGVETPRMTERDVLNLIRKHVKTSKDDSGTSEQPTLDVERPEVELKVDDYEVTAFREMMEKVEAVRREEREAERAKAAEERMLRRLDRLELGLNDNQKQEILKVHRTHRDKMRETFSKLRESGAGREEYRAAIEPMREELTKSIENIVPGDDAQKVVQSLGGGLRGGFDRGGARQRNRGR